MAISTKQESIILAGKYSSTKRDNLKETNIINAYLFWNFINNLQIKMEGIGDTWKDKETIQKLSDGHPVILLRHAESMHNETSNGIKSREHTQEERLKDWIDKEHRDSPLNAVGIQQCEEASEVMNELNVGIVLISPMRRALETAYHIFKNHPNFDMIKFLM